MPPQHHPPAAESRLESHNLAMDHPPPASGSLSAPSESGTHESVTPKPSDSSMPSSNATMIEPSSAPDSQNSMASSSARNQDPQLQVSSSDISQSTYGEVLDRDMTPPSSSSAYSSQEQPSQPLQYSSLKPYRPAVDENMSDDVETRTEGTPVENVSMERCESTQSSRSGSSVELAPGQKRTASGAVKNSIAPPGYNLGKPREPGHSRTMSSDSSSSKMAEVSHWLSSRSTYITNLL